MCELTAPWWCDYAMWTITSSGFIMFMPAIVVGLWHALFDTTKARERNDLMSGRNWRPDE